MKKYGNFINESTSQTVFLNDNRGSRGFTTNKYGENSIAQLNTKILNYISEVYGSFGFTYPRGGNATNYNISVEGKVYKSEYISKMVNNYTIFKTFIKQKRIRDAKTFYELIEANFADIYHYNGRFFREQSLPILINTTRKGNRSEIRCKTIFENYAKSKGLNIIVDNPTVDEDITGIDGKFTHGGRVFTLQIKPFTNYNMNTRECRIESNGSLSVGSVDYLVLYKGANYIIAKNPKSNQIKIDGTEFVVPSNNITFI